MSVANAALEKYVAFGQSIAGSFHELKMVVVLVN